MKFIAVVIFLSLLVSSCGGYKSEVTQTSDKAFLKFNTNDKVFYFAVDEGTYIQNDIEVEQYEIKPGKHTVKVYRDNQLVVDRVIYVDNHATFEIEVP
jgi:hypothetical protein